MAGPQKRSMLHGKMVLKNTGSKGPNTCIIQVIDDQICIIKKQKN